MKNDSALKLVDRIAKIKDLLDANKPLYEELDDLIMKLVKVVQIGETTQTEDERFVTLVDNFEDKNTCFKVAGVKRFDVLLMDKEQFKKRIAKNRDK